MVSSTGACRSINLDIYPEAVARPSTVLQAGDGYIDTDFRHFRALWEESQLSRFLDSYGASSQSIPMLRLSSDGQFLASVKMVSRLHDPIHLLMTTVSWKSGV